MPSPITLEALQTLASIDHKGSFAAAAEEMHKVPSAVSYTIQKLEQDLGAALFNRSGHRAELTPAGQLVLQQGQQILQAVSALTIAARRVASGWEARLRIAVDTIVPIKNLLPLIKTFCELQPAPEIELLEEVLGGTLDALLCDRADLAIGAANLPNTTGYKVMPLGEIKFIFAVSPGHPLCSCPEPVTPAQIKQYPAIVAADSSRNIPPLSSGLLDDQPRITVANLQTKLDAQATGLGVGFVPEHLAQPYLRNRRLVALNIAKPKPPAPLHIVWRKDNTGKALSWFLQRLEGTKILAPV